MIQDINIRLTSASSPVASIIICVSNGIDLLIECLLSIQMWGPKELPFETIIVLNAPSPENVRRLQETVRGAKIVASPVNLGLAGGSNRGRAQARGRYLILLHDDATIEPGWLEALVKAAEDHPEAGAVGGKVLHMDSRLQSAGLCLLSNAVLGRIDNEVMPGCVEARRTVDLCGTASLLMRASLWDAIGGLDERFYPAYYVDADIGMSVRAHGFVMLYEPTSVIRHRAGSSTQLDRRHFLFRRNRHLFKKKWGDALTAFEPMDQNDLAGSTARAVARAANRRAIPQPANLATPSRPGALDVSAQQGRHIRQQLDLHEAFEHHLLARLAKARLNAGPVYTLGQTLSFDDGGEAYRYQIAGGCHEAETWGAWMKSTRLRMVLALADDALQDSAGLRIGLKLTHFIATIRPVSPFTVSLNGHVVLHRDETMTGPLLYQFDIPSNLYSQIGCLVLQIDTKGPISSADTGLDNDPRVRSVGLCRLRVDKLTPDETTARSGVGE